MVGGGALLSTSGIFGFNLPALERPDFLQRHPRYPRIINMIQLADALLDVTDPPVQGLFVYNSNPANVAPDSGRVRAGLEVLRTHDIPAGPVHTIEVFG